MPRSLLSPHLHAIESSLDANPEYKASTHSTTLTFALLEEDVNDHIIIDILNGGTRVHTYSAEPSFTLSAQSSHWESFFKPPNELKPPFQSYWGMLRTLDGVKVLGDTTTFAQYARVWRLFLDRARETVMNAKRSAATGSSSDDDEEPEIVDHITGRYIHTHTPLFGHCRLFTESSTSDPNHSLQPLLFLHTAGSDSRQYHRLMNSPQLLERFSMYAFDLPAHGRSDLGSKQVIGDKEFGLDEESYVELIAQVIVKLGLKDAGVIVCGASMAGQICLSLALSAHTLNIKGVVACEACAHIPTSPPIYAYNSSSVDEGVLNPETVCGMMSPISPAKYKREVWWGYSAQGYGVFRGDLRFYFSGWDGRSRLKGEEGKGVQCPVYMLTGEFDYSCTPAMSKDTYEMMGGRANERVQFEVMKGLGHFPASEDAERFVQYLMRGVEFIEAKAKKGGEEVGLNPTYDDGWERV